MRDDAQRAGQFGRAAQGLRDAAGGGAGVEVHGLAGADQAQGGLGEVGLAALVQRGAVLVALVLAGEGGAAVHLADQAAPFEGVEVAAGGGAADAEGLGQGGGAQAAVPGEQVEDALEAVLREWCVHLRPL